MTVIGDITSIGDYDMAQNFVDNATYFPAKVKTNPRFQERLAREVPLGSLVAAREYAQECVVFTA